jgi:hypothetical protein
MIRLAAISPYCIASYSSFGPPAVCRGSLPEQQAVGTVGVAHIGQTMFVQLGCNK